MRYRAEARSSSPSALSKSPATSDAMARRPWTSSLTVTDRRDGCDGCMGVRMPCSDRSDVRQIDQHA